MVRTPKTKEYIDHFKVQATHSKEKIFSVPENPPEIYSQAAAEEAQNKWGNYQENPINKIYSTKLFLRKTMTILNKLKDRNKNIWSLSEVIKDGSIKHMSRVLKQRE